MKKICYMLLVAIMVYGCYEDKGNYSYSTLTDLEVSLPDESHSLLFGERLRITPTIETSIPESDLAYAWEFWSDTIRILGGSWTEYIAVYKERTFDYVCERGKVLPGESTYDLRLNVTQVSTGRHFYSNVVKVQLSDLPSLFGAMVLHGDGTSTDIGMIVAAEFQKTEPSDSFTDEIYTNYYSEINGEKIKGKGKSIIQTYLSGTAIEPEFIRLIALTDQSSAWIESRTFERVGEWNDLFFDGVNKGIPQGWFLDSSSFLAWDGGSLYRRRNTNILFSAPKVVDGGAPDYNLEPRYFHSPSSRLYAGLLFDNKTRGFVGIKNTTTDSPATLAVFNVPGALFNPADLKADLVFMDAGGEANNMLAVMKKDDGDYFMIQMDMSQTNAANVPRHIYELTHLPDVQNGKVLHWDFAISFTNMCFYATSAGVYQFAVRDGLTIDPQPLRMTNNDPVEFDGDVTMMKILKTNHGFSYYLRNMEMVVGTYGGSAGSGKLYSIKLNQLTGRAESVKVYSDFDQIYDVNIKGW